MAYFEFERNSRFISPEIHILTVNIKTDSWNYPSLSSPYWRLYWHFSGEARVNMGGTLLTLTRERRYLIPPHTEFSSSSSGLFRQCYIHFLVNTPAGQISDKPVSGIYGLKIRSGMNDLFQEIVNRKGGPSHMDSHTSQLAASLCSLSLADLPVHAMAEPIGDERIVRAVDYIRSHLNTPIKAFMIAEAAGMSIKSLERVFLRTFAMTPLRYRQKLRIDQACMMLHFSNLSLNEIADTLGFNDRFHFTRVFTHLMGISPGRYREMTDELTG